MVPTIPTVKFNDGASIPTMGFGTGTAWLKRDPSAPLDRDLVNMIKSAIQQGYRHLDCAEGYNTEEELGVAIKQSGIPREELFVTTKVIQSIDNVSRAIDTSLKKLQLGYVDLFLIHSPYFAKSDTELQTTWKGMEDIKQSGKAKSIGVSNFTRPHLEAILKTATIKPAANQMEYHAYFQRANNFVSWMQEQDITVMAYFGLMPLKHAKSGPLTEPLDTISKNHGVDSSAVLMRWLLNRGIVSISTSKKTERVQQYFQALGLELNSEEMGVITEVGKSYHFRVRLPKPYAPDWAEYPDEDKWCEEMYY
ncbi:hypothetical protein N7478_002281 [Penicillium angulare]|uniref:uncharacterized protein n=1 Tax=Penicillium angulare TaxID=116970 RepID=UPI00254246A4|nr:uncharacterized protein N7478_002281 [Penicillium angulare]KAJ5286595.1 hypothetical protein N7478_002281 [Penicillium angulare]